MPKFYEKYFKCEYVCAKITIVQVLTFESDLTNLHNVKWQKSSFMGLIFLICLRISLVLSKKIAKNTKNMKNWIV